MIRELHDKRLISCNVPLFSEYFGGESYSLLGKAGFLPFPDDAWWLKRSNNTNSSVLVVVFPHWLKLWRLPFPPRLEPLKMLKPWKTRSDGGKRTTTKKKLLELQMWASCCCPLTDPAIAHHHLFEQPAHLTLQPCTAIHTAAYRTHSHTHHQMWRIKAQAGTHHRALL